MEKENKDVEASKTRSSFKFAFVPFGASFTEAYHCTVAGEDLTYAKAYQSFIDELEKHFKHCWGAVLMSDFDLRSFSFRLIDTVYLK